MTFVRVTPETFYRRPIMAAWREGRVDSKTDPLTLRLHQVVQASPLLFSADGRPSQLDRSVFDAAKSRRYALLGSACDEGVKRNGGRPGAVQGPEAIRRALRNVPLHYPQADLLDAGDLVFKEAAARDPLEAFQTSLGLSVKTLLDESTFPIVMGGGNEASFGTGSGIYQWCRDHSSRPRVGILLWDAHFDLRSVEERGVTSGTPFWQLSELCKAHGDPFFYMVVGLRRAANTLRLFATARELGAQIVYADEMMEMNLHRLARAIDAFLDQVDVVYETVDMDVFGAGFAPGVSAVNPDGVTPGPLFYTLFDRVAASGKLIAFETTELNPTHDPDGRTASLNTTLIDRVIYERERAG